MELDRVDYNEITKKSKAKQEAISLIGQSDECILIVRGKDDNHELIIISDNGKEMETLGYSLAIGISIWKELETKQND